MREAVRKTADEGLLLEAEKTVSQCDRCGACLPVCPLFGTRDVESSGARGKNAIARALAEGGIAPTAGVLAAADFCLLCRACVEECPNGVRTDEAMIDVRQYLAERIGRKNAKLRVVAGILKNRGLVKLATGALSLLRGLGLNGALPCGIAPEEFTRANFLAAFAGPAALGGKVKPSGAVPTGARVACFRGCGMRMLFPAASAGTRAILSASARVMLKDNVCCGLPHLAHGMRGAFLSLARENIRLYEDADVVVSDCASCSGTLKRLGAWFADDPLWKGRADAFSSKVMDLTEYLAGIGYRPRKRVNATLTYHDPCHLVRGQGIRNAPRDLLRAAGNFVEMEEADVCCGGAGTFSLDYPDISSRILGRKRENIERTGAAVVVTSCPGCLIQLARAAKESGRFRAMHISQVL
jgi:glycolate oxidase iron-sulfur subunit